MRTYSDSWAAREFAGVNLGDQRLNQRFMKLADDFSKHPEFSINQACDDWGAAKAADAFEFGHSLSSLIGGQIVAGFSIVGFYEDEWGEGFNQLIDKILPQFIATRALKLS